MKYWAFGSGRSAKGGLGLVSRATGEHKLNIGLTQPLLSSIGSFVRNKSSIPISIRGWTSPARHSDGDRRGNFERNKGVRHLSYGELMERKAKGLCFRCSDKFHPLHRCSGQLRLIELSDNEMVNKQGEIVALEVEDIEEEGALECKSMGVLGVNDAHYKGVKTMRFWGSIDGISIMVLIDSGACHNFIAPSVVTALELQVDPMQRLGVRLGDEHRVWTQGK